MTRQKKNQNASEPSGEGQYPRREGSEYEIGRQEDIKEREEKRIWDIKEGGEDRIRENEVKNAHAHTPYFEYDNPTYEDRDEAFKVSSQNNKKNKSEKK
jgi:hypothetical protein